ncbi:hypothetical protein GNI_141420 [Gregarina niphandrodes]|uniref:Uncharacterized protein n=1 Tax=Gregarina niphandrodes TaxID=110365 RepID=A0A023B081_GRENI|nr:hypothetical protein GNI_141420 [Gregarina niphandrodes]EZG45044.1 hypothetical protein GNI_141420 [Gregarina niphandrodes]|eukprot:XP_011132593.1 hypothetical protein GNI_141420 [Gregarina niphandrodes]
MLPNECSQLVTTLWAGGPGAKDAKEKIEACQTSEDGWGLAVDCLRSDFTHLNFFGSQLLSSKVKQDHPGCPPLHFLLSTTLECYRGLIARPRLLQSRPVDDDTNRRKADYEAYGQLAKSRVLSLIPLIFDVAVDLTPLCEVISFSSRLPTAPSGAATHGTGTHGAATQGGDEEWDLYEAGLFEGLSEVPPVLAKRESMSYNANIWQSAFVLPYTRTVDNLLCSGLKKFGKRIVDLSTTQDVRFYDRLLLDLRSVAKAVAYHMDLLGELPKTGQVLKQVLALLQQLYMSLNQRQQVDILALGLAALIHRVLAVSVPGLLKPDPIVSLRSTEIATLFRAAIGTLLQVLQRLDNSPDLGGDWDAKIVEDAVDEMVACCSETLSLPAGNEEMSDIFSPMAGEILLFLQKASLTPCHRIFVSVTEAFSALSEGLKSARDEGAESVLVERLEEGLARTLMATWLQSLLQVVECEEDADDEYINALCDGSMDGFMLLLPLYINNPEALHFILETPYEFTRLSQQENAQLGATHLVGANLPGSNRPVEGSNLLVGGSKTQHARQVCIDAFWTAVGETLVILVDRNVNNVLLRQVMNGIVVAEVVPATVKLLETASNYLRRETLRSLLFDSAPAPDAGVPGRPPSPTGLSVATDGSTTVGTPRVNVTTEPGLFSRVKALALRRSHMQLVDVLCFILKRLDASDSDLLEFVRQANADEELRDAAAIPFIARATVLLEDLPTLEFRIGRACRVFAEGTDVESIFRHLLFAFVTLHSCHSDDVNTDARCSVSFCFSSNRFIQALIAVAIKSNLLLTPLECHQLQKRGGEQYCRTPSTVYDEVLKNQELSPAKFTRLVYHTLRWVTVMVLPDTDDETLLNCLLQLNAQSSKAMFVEPGFMAVLENLVKQSRQRRILDTLMTIHPLPGSPLCELTLFDNLTLIDEEPFVYLIRSALYCINAYANSIGRPGFPAFLEARPEFPTIQNAVLNILAHSTNGPLLREACNLARFLRNEKDQILRTILARFTLWPNSFIIYGVAVVKAFIYEANNESLINDFVRILMAPLLANPLVQSGVVIGSHELVLRAYKSVRGKLLDGLFGDIWRIDNKELLPTDLLRNCESALERYHGPVSEPLYMTLDDL